MSKMPRLVGDLHRAHQSPQPCGPRLGSRHGVDWYRLPVFWRGKCPFLGGAPCIDQVQGHFEFQNTHPAHALGIL